MMEFALNSSMSTSTGYAPFELNYGYIPQLEQRLHTNTNSKFVGVHQFVEQALWNIMATHDAIIAAHMMQTYCQDTDFSKKYELGLEEKS